MDFAVFKFLHVATIIATIVLAEGSILPILIAARRRDVVALRHAIAAGEVGDRLSNPMLVISLAFGVAAALTGQIDLTEPWLVASYGVIVVGFAGIGLGGGFRHIERVKRAAEESPVDAPSAELIAALDHPWTRGVTILPPILMAVLVFLMVVKPDLW